MISVRSHCQVKFLPRYLFLCRNAVVLATEQLSSNIFDKMGLL